MRVSTVSPEQTASSISNLLTVLGLRKTDQRAPTYELKKKRGQNTDKGPLGLPNELLIQIFNLLDAEDRPALANASHDLHQFARPWIAHDRTSVALQEYGKGFASLSPDVVGSLDELDAIVNAVLDPNGVFKSYSAFRTRPLEVAVNRLCDGTWFDPERPENRGTSERHMESIERCLDGLVGAVKEKTLPDSPRIFIGITRAIARLEPKRWGRAEEKINGVLRDVFLLDVNNVTPVNDEASTREQRDKAAPIVAALVWTIPKSFGPHIAAPVESAKAYEKVYERYEAVAQHVSWDRRAEVYAALAGAIAVYSDPSERTRLWNKYAQALKELPPQGRLDGYLALDAKWDVENADWDAIPQNGRSARAALHKSMLLTVEELASGTDDPALLDRCQDAFTHLFGTIKQEDDPPRIATLRGYLESAERAFPNGDPLRGPHYRTTIARMSKLLPYLEVEEHVQLQGLIGPAYRQGPVGEMSEDRMAAWLDTVRRLSVSNVPAVAEARQDVRAYGLACAEHLKQTGEVAPTWLADMVRDLIAAVPQDDPEDRRQVCQELWMLCRSIEPDHRQIEAENELYELCKHYGFVSQQPGEPTDMPAVGRRRANST